MLKPIKWIFSILVILVIVVIAAIVTIANTIDPNDYLSQASDMVHEKTGLTLNVASIDWSFFPWLGIKVDQASLSDPAQQALASLDEVQIRIKVLPLLQQKIEIGSVQLVKLDLQVVIDKEGNLNWNQLAQSEQAPPESTTEPSATDPNTNTETPDIDILISELIVVDSQLTYRDDSTQTQTTLSELNITSKDILLSTTKTQTNFPLEIAFKLADKTGLALTTKLTTDIALDQNGPTLSLSNLTLNNTANLPGMANAIVTNLNANLSLDMAKNQAQLEQLAIDVDNLIKLNADLKVAALDTAPKFAGSLKLDIPNLRALAKQHGAELPPSADPNVLQTLSLKTSLNGTTKSIRLTPITLKLDDSTLTGKIAITDFAKQALVADLTLDSIDVDRYAPPPSDDPEPNAEPSPNTSDSDTNSETPAGDLIPVELLRTLNLNTALKINQLKAQGIAINQLLIKLQGANGLVTLDPISGQTLEGKFLAKASVDVSGEEPVLTFYKSLDKMQLEPAMKAFADSNLLAGILQFGGDLKTRGNNTDAWIRNLTGNSDFQFTQGLLRGINLTELTFEKMGTLGTVAQAFIGEETKQKAPPVFRKDTDINQLLAKVVFKDGVAQANELDLSINDAAATGSAAFDLVTHDLEFTLNLKLSEGIANPTLAKLTWPVRCKGNITAAPSCSIDSKPVRKAIEKMAKERAKSEAKAKLADALKEKAGIELGDQSVEEAAKQEVKSEAKKKEDEAKEKLKNKLEEKFKGFF